jgi:hypothetical protein
MDSRNLGSAPQKGGVGIGFVLFIVFLILKLTDTVDWSWGWIFAPLWIPFAFGLLLLGVAYLIVLLSRD